MILYVGEYEYGFFVINFLVDEIIVIVVVSVYYLFIFKKKKSIVIKIMYIFEYDYL